MPYTQTVDLTNQVFGQLTVLKRADFKKPGGAYWDCLCTCGSVYPVMSQALRNGHQTRCTDCVHRVSGNIGRRASYLYGCYRLAASRKGKKARPLPFELTPEHFLVLISGNCFYCGVEPQLRAASNKHPKIFCNGVDRVDSSKGYLLNNCVSCCSTCNRAKLAMTREEFLAWVRRAYEHNYGKHN
jgi:hypothetical protein